MALHGSMINVDICVRREPNTRIRIVDSYVKVDHLICAGDRWRKADLRRCQDLQVVGSAVLNLLYVLGFMT